MLLRGLRLNGAHSPFGGKPACRGLDQPIGDDGDGRDAQSRHQTAPGIGLGQGHVDLLAEIARADERSDDEHGEREHHRLIDAEENDGRRKWQPDLGQQLAFRAAGSRAGLDERRRNVANAVRCVAHGGRQRVEHDGDHRGEVADPEQHDHRYEVDEARQGLQRVDDGLQNPPDAGRKAAHDAKGDADGGSDDDRDAAQIDGLHRVLPLAIECDEHGQPTGE